jgi:hypothetical protein
MILTLIRPAPELAYSYITDNDGIKIKVKRK